MSATSSDQQACRKAERQFRRLVRESVTCLTGLGYDIQYPQRIASCVWSTAIKNHFSLLDPLRFGAAFGVALFHQLFWSWAWVSIGHPGFERTVAADVQYPSAAPFTWFGWVGVEIFFVISGFVIANSASRSSPKQFLVGRALS